MPQFLAERLQKGVIDVGLGGNVENAGFLAKCFRRGWVLLFLPIGSVDCPDSEHGNCRRLRDEVVK